MRQFDFIRLNAWDRGTAFLPSRVWGFVSFIGDRNLEKLGWGERGRTLQPSSNISFTLMGYYND